MPEASLKVVPITKNKDYDGFVDAERRYIIVDADGVVVDDAQGYGYKSQRSAHKAMWYKFKGGKDKVASANAAGKRYWGDKKKLAEAIEKCAEDNFKDVARRETTIDDIVACVEKDLGASIDRRMAAWLMQQ